MASSTSLILVAVTLAVVSSTPQLASFEGAESHHLIVGQREYSDKLVFQQSISIPASIFGRKVIHEQIFNAIKGHVITQVAALDEINDGTGASAVVTGGGPGRESVKLRFKSQRFHGIYFIVQIYGKPKF